MPTPKQLREERAVVAKSIRQMADKVNAENREFTAEESEQWNKINDDYNALTRRIDVAEAADRIDAEQRQPVGDPRIGRGPLAPRGGDGAQEISEAHRDLALQAWCRSQFGLDLEETQREACELLRFNPHVRQLDMPLYSTRDARNLQQRFRQVHPNRAVDHCGDFKATLTTGSGPGGGYLIPPETMLRQLEVNMLAFGGVRQVAETIRTSTGERMSWITGDDTTNTGVQLGESASIGSSVDPTFAKVYWDAYKFSSKPILVPFELIRDSMFDLPGQIGGYFGERLGRITNTKFTTGTGAATPKGIVTAATSFAAASATAIIFDDILGLEHAVDPSYRIGASFMLHDSILLYIRKLKDGNGNYLWQSNVQVGRPDTLHGYGMTINQDMDSTVASGKKTILFGQLFKYKIRTVGAMRMYRLEERYRDTDQDGFIAFISEDGNLLTAGTAPVKYLSH